MPTHAICSMPLISVTEARQEGVDCSKHFAFCCSGRCCLNRSAKESIVKGKTIGTSGVGAESSAVLTPSRPC